MDNKKKLIEALDLIKVMGAIIRTLDTENSHCEYWLNDGDYVPAAEAFYPNDDEPIPTRTYHVIEVTFLSKKMAVVLRSYYCDQELTIPLKNEPGSITPAIDTAKKYLADHGFNIVGHCTSKGKEIYYIVTDTFTPLVAV